MAISDFDFRALREEVLMAEKVNEQELEPVMRESLERYLGKFVPIIAKDWTIVLNEIYPIIQFNLPSIFFRNPRVFLKPRNKTFIAKRRNLNTGRMEDQILDAQKSARTQSAVVNHIMEQIHYKQEVRRVLLDALLFPHGVMWHGYKGNFGMTEEDSMFIRDESVFVKRLSPLRFLKDPTVPIHGLEEARWTGRSFDVRLLDLLEDETLDVDQTSIKGIRGFGQKIGTKEFLEQQKLGGQDKITASQFLKPLLERASKDFQSSPHARFVRLYEIFLRPTKKERRKGSNGSVIVFTFEQFKRLRENNWPYKGEGLPGKVLMFNEAPEQPFGLADTQVYGDIADHKNLVINQQIRNAEQLNKVFVGIAKENADEEDVEKVRRGESGVIRFDSETITGKMFVQAANVGASNELYLLDTRIDKNLQDKSGVSDLKKGFLQSGEESKFSVQQRALGGSARPQYRQDIMADFLRDSVGFISDLSKQFFPVTKAVRITGTLDVEWTDDFTKEELQADTDVHLDVQSMIPESPERELQELSQVLNLMTGAITNPEILRKIQTEGNTFNISPILQQLLIRLKINDPDVFRRIKVSESQGFVSVAEMRAAQQNVDAALQGQPPPSPPSKGQNHRARLEVYARTAKLLQALGQQSQIIEQLLQQQAALLQELQQKESPAVGSRVPQVSKNGGGTVQPVASVR